MAGKGARSRADTSGTGSLFQAPESAQPLAARIVAVVDVADALLHKRPYKEPWTFEATMRYIAERRGKQFDPTVVDALFALMENGPPEWLLAGD